MIVDINLGAAPNDKTGNSARAGGGIINANFAYLDAKINNVDKIIAQTGYSLVGQILTVSAGWSWKILGVAYTNPVDVANTIPFAAAGKQRLDMFVLNQSNTYSRITGIEGDLAVSPPKPNNTIEAFLVLVNDSSVGGSALQTQINALNSEPQTFTAPIDGINQEFTLSPNFKPRLVFKSNGFLRKGEQWTYTGNKVKILINLKTGNTIDIIP